jgi:NAD(P)-dependent dehydrogenase (short-subunit alcohol dehydrogenase family)
VVFTGAARGIGAQTARLLHSQGAKLVLPDLDEQPLVAPADELGSADVLSVACDVRHLAAMEDAVAQAWTGSAGSTRDGQRQDRELRLGAAGRSRDVKNGCSTSTSWGSSTPCAQPCPP